MPRLLLRQFAIGTPANEQLRQAHQRNKQQGSRRKRGLLAVSPWPRITHVQPAPYPCIRAAPRLRSVESAPAVCFGAPATNRRERIRLCRVPAEVAVEHFPAVLCTGPVRGAVLALDGGLDASHAALFGSLCISPSQNSSALFCATAFFECNRAEHSCPDNHESQHTAQHSIVITHLTHPPATTPSAPRLSSRSCCSTGTSARAPAMHHPAT